MSSTKEQLAVDSSATGTGVGKARMPQYEELVRLVGKRLNLRREEAGYSLRQLQEKTGISMATISRIENGLQREMAAAVFFALCEALAFDPLKAWYGDERKPKAAAPRKANSEPPPESTSRPSSRPGK